MIVKFFVVQEDEEGKRSNKFLFERDLQEPLMNGTYHPFEGTMYTVVEQQVFKDGFKNTVEAYCYEFKSTIFNETNSQDTTSGDSEDVRLYE